MYNQDRQSEHGMSKDEIAELIKNESPKVIIELGASDGSDTECLISKLSENYKYFAVEADPRNIQRFRVKDKRLTLINAAVFDEDKEEGIFHICTGIIPQWGRPHYDGSTTKPVHPDTFKDAPWMTFTPIKIPFIKLDTLLNIYNIPKVDFIWCDVEGAVEEVIKGGLNAFKVVKYFYTEFLNTEGAYSHVGDIGYDEIVSLMNSINFEIVYKFHSDALFRNKLL